MIKSWLDLYRLNISKHTEKLPHKYVPKKIGNKTIFKPHPDTSKYLDYLSWSKCLALLYENGAKSIIIGRGAMDMNVPNLDHFVTVRVEIDSVARALIYPMIKGTKILKEPNPLEIHICEQRAFVKCVAINWGLGLKLWHKSEKLILEEPHEELIPEVTTEIMEKRSELINTLGAIRVKHALNHEQFFKKYNTTKEEMKNVISNGSILELDGWINSFKMELE